MKEGKSTQVGELSTIYEDHATQVGRGCSAVPKVPSVFCVEYVCIIATFTLSHLTRTPRSQYSLTFSIHYLALQTPLSYQHAKKRYRIRPDRGAQEAPGE